MVQNLRMPHKNPIQSLEIQIPPDWELGKKSTTGGEEFPSLSLEKSHWFVLKKIGDVELLGTCGPGQGSLEPVVTYGKAG